MTYTYIELQREQSFLHSYTHAMVIMGDGKTFEFVHNFPPSGKVSILTLLAEWTNISTLHTVELFAGFIRQWRNRRKWMVLKNKHFFDCFVVPVSALERESLAHRFHDEWWISRF